MTLPATLNALAWLVRDTFRQALASRVFWLMFGASALCILFCASVRIEGDRPLKGPGDIELWGGDNKPLTGPNPGPGHVTVGFGAVRLALFRDGPAEVHFILVLLARWVAGFAGMLLALVWAAGFVPEFLQPQAASVLLTKPVPRWVLVAGKYLGVVTLVAGQALLFFGGTFLALGWGTGVWHPGYLLGVPLLVMSFALIYSFAVLLGVCTRSTAACVFGALLFLVLCYGMNYGRHTLAARAQLAPETQPPAAGFRALVEAGYWVLPKPGDLGTMLDEGLEAREHFLPLPAFDAVRRTGDFDPGFIFLSSGLFALGMLAVASRQLGQTEY